MGNNTGIQVPEDVVERLGSSKRPLVKVTINNDYTYRSAVAVMGDKYMISLSKAHRSSAGVEGGDQVEIAVELDLEPRGVEIPADLKSALVNANALEAFEKSAPSMKKEYVRQVEDAKKQETRERRIAKIVDKFVN
jgi:antitoxin component of MazEF toxin-antitoxin module